MKPIDFSLAIIKDEYLYGEPAPWVIGFSGGKDSTCMLQLVWIAMQQIKDAGQPLDRRIIISSNDTAIENPLIADLLYRTVQSIRDTAQTEEMPIECHITRPRLTEQFWVKVIGNGYPIPNNTFRWCTDRLKIQPTSRMITDVLGQYKEAVLLLGTRKSESKTREKSIQRNSQRGKRLSDHPTHYGLKVFSPIADLDVEHVWQVIRSMPCPWGSNQELFDLYAGANSDDYECPTVITDKAHKTCGQSRFGCWICPVVKKDKSMTALVNSGNERLRPLLDFRNAIVDERSNVEFRMPFRRNGLPSKNGMGPYTMEYRKNVLRRLLALQKQTGYELIGSQQVIAIGMLWMREWGDFSGDAGRIYREVQV